MRYAKVIMVVYGIVGLIAPRGSSASLVTWEFAGKMTRVVDRRGPVTGRL